MENERGKESRDHVISEKLWSVLQFMAILKSMHEKEVVPSQSG